MISFSEVGKLYSRKIDKNNNSSNTSTPSNTNLPSSQPSNLVYLVGQERDGIFLVARDDLYLNRTCIELVDLPNKDRKVLYAHDNHIRCVSASLNQQRTILAYSTFRKRKNQTIVYESFLVEVNPSAAATPTSITNRYLFNIRGPQYQNIQFLYDKKVNTTATSATSHFLFFRDKERIEMYSIGTERKFGVTQITNQPELQFTFVRRFLWCQWDPQSSMLYYIVATNQSQFSSSLSASAASSMSNSTSTSAGNTMSPVTPNITISTAPPPSPQPQVISSLLSTNQQTPSTPLSPSASPIDAHPSNGINHSSPNPSSTPIFLNVNTNYSGHLLHKSVLMDCSLRCFSFADIKKPTILFDCVVPLSIPVNMFQENYIPEYDRRQPWLNGHSSPDLSLQLSIIKFSNNGLCLCQQHKQRVVSSSFHHNTSATQVEVDISIFLLHHKQRFDFTIPITIHTPNFSQSSESSLKKLNNQIKVHFGNVHDMLLVYVPGLYLQLFEVNGERDPWPIILPWTFLNSHMGFMNQFSPLLPGTLPSNQEQNHAFTMSHVERTITVSYGKKNSSSNGEVMINLKRGIIYDVEIDMEWMLNNLFDNGLYKVLPHHLLKQSIMDLLQFCIKIDHLKMTCYSGTLVQKLYHHGLIQEVYLKQYLISYTYELLNLHMERDTLALFSKFVPVSLKEIKYKKLLHSQQNNSGGATTNGSNANGASAIHLGGVILTNSLQNITTVTNYFSSYIVPFRVHRVLSDLTLYNNHSESRIRKLSSTCCMVDKLKLHPTRVHFNMNNYFFKQPPPPTIEQGSLLSSPSFKLPQHPPPAVTTPVPKKKISFFSLFSTSSRSTNLEEDLSSSIATSPAVSSPALAASTAHKEEVVNDVQKKMIYDALTDILQTCATQSKHFPNTKEAKSKISTFITDYTANIFKSCTELFASINKLTKTKTILPDSPENGLGTEEQLPEKRYFRLLETYFSAVEGIGYPMIVDFMEHFSQVAYLTLPQRVFLQYMEKDLILLSSTFFHFISKFMTETRHDEGSFYQTIVRIYLRKSKMSNYYDCSSGTQVSALSSTHQQQLQEYLKEIANHYQKIDFTCNRVQLMEYMHFLMGVHPQSNSGELLQSFGKLIENQLVIDNQVFNDPSDFLPMSYFLLSLLLTTDSDVILNSIIDDYVSIVNQIHPSSSAVDKPLFPNDTLRSFIQYIREQGPSYLFKE